MRPWKPPGPRKPEWDLQWPPAKSAIWRIAAPRPPKTPAALIEESIAKSTEGNKKLPLVAGSIQQVTDSATPVKALLDEVDVGSQRPSRAIEQIAPAVTRLEVVSQRSTVRAERSAAADEELAALAQTVYGIAERVRRRGHPQDSGRQYAAGNARGGAGIAAAEEVGGTDDRFMSSVWILDMK